MILIGFRIMIKLSPTRIGEVKMLQDKLKEMLQNAVCFDLDGQRELAAGCSKFGGKPDLPQGVEWPYFEGIWFDGAKKKFPLSFIAQINCKEVHPFDREGKLPSSGMLYFFYEIVTMNWGLKPEDRGSARVIYCPEEKELVATDFPEDLWDLFRFPEYALRFDTILDLPDYQEMDEIPAGEDFESFEKARTEMGYRPPERRNKLLGYADLIQDEMRVVCVLNSLGVPEEEQGEYLAEHWEEVSNEIDDWMLLCQFDSFNREDFELIFGEMGRLYYYIKKSDLKKLDFDHIWAVLQSE